MSCPKNYGSPPASGQFRVGKDIDGASPFVAARTLAADAKRCGVECQTLDAGVQSLDAGCLKYPHQSPGYPCQVGAIPLRQASDVSL